MDDRLGRVLAIAHKHYHAHVDRAMGEIGSSIHTHIFLSQIQHRPGITQRELAEQLFILGPTITHHLDRLVASGLVERTAHPEDRRARVIRLTVAGESALRQTNAVADRLEHETRQVLSDSEMRTLVELLGRLREHYPIKGGR